MKIYKTYVNCRICSRKLAESSFKKHLEKHYDPKSRLCKFWYKQYFKNDNGVTVCAICDEEIHPEMKTSRFEYETHLKQNHNIVQVKGNI